MDTVKTAREVFEKFMQINGQPILEPEVVDWLEDHGFFTAPAAAKHHGNVPGGLFLHSKAVAEALVHLTEDLNLIWKRPESPYIVGMLHDLCKIDQYRPVMEKDDLGHMVPTGEFEFTKDTPLPGHGDKSVMMLAGLMKLTEEEVMCIRYHMGAFTDRSEWNYYTRACHDYPNVLFTHTADMIASQIWGV